MGVSVEPAPKSSTVVDVPILALPKAGVPNLGYAKQLLGGTRLCAPIPGNKYERAIISQNLQRNCGIEFFEFFLVKLIISHRGTLAFQRQCL